MPAEQAMQAVLLKTYWPASHESQLSRLVVENLPSRHLSHSKDPVLVATLPSGQRAHCVGHGGEATLVYWPGGHNMHVPDDKKVPRSQCTVGNCVGSCVGPGEGSGVGWAVGSGVGCGVGSGAGCAVGRGVSSGVGSGVGAAETVGAGVGSGHTASVEFEQVPGSEEPQPELLVLPQHE